MKFEPYEGKEDNLQISCIQYLRLQYPEVLCFHVANERKTSPQAGARLKRKGVLAGVPDILVIDAKKDFNGFAIELKVKGGKLSKHQKDRLSDFSARNWKTLVIYSFDEFEAEINAYLS